MKKGFSILECLIYAALSLILILSLYEHFIRLYNLSKSFISSFSQQQEGVLLGYLVRSDLYSALPLESQWDISRCIFVKQTLNSKGEKSEICIQWEIKKHSLYRSHGKYDFIQKEWKEKKTTLMNTAVASFSIKCIKELNGNKFKGAFICITFLNKQSHNESVMFRNQHIIERKINNEKQ